MPVRPSTGRPRAALARPSTTPRWKMFPARIASGSSGSRFTSASSMAGPRLRSRIRRRRRRTGGRSRPRCTAISGSATGEAQSPTATAEPGVDDGGSGQEADDGASVPSRSSAAGEPKPTFQPSRRHRPRGARGEARAGRASPRSIRGSLTGSRIRPPRASRRRSSPRRGARPRRPCCRTRASARAA